MPRFIILVSLLLASLLVRCSSDKSSQPVPSDPKVINMSDYLIVDTTKPALVRATINDSSIFYTEEPMWWCEYVIIDHFSDLNGNGEYDAGIDSFIISSDSLVNQDLNHNGKYDPPTIDEWNQGYSHFDDLSGDGIYNCAYDPEYFVGAPYVDANLNGQWDKSQPYYVTAGLWRLAQESADAYSYNFEAPFYPFRFISDSGLAYHMWGYPEMEPPDLIFDSLGLHMKLHPEILFARLGQMRLDTTYLDSFMLGDTLVRLQRTATYHKTFAAPESTYTNVVGIRIDSIFVNGILEGCPCQHRELYLARHRGLMLISDCSGCNFWVNWWLSDRLDSLPAPMRQ